MGSMITIVIIEHYYAMTREFLTIASGLDYRWRNYILIGYQL